MDNRASNGPLFIIILMFAAVGILLANGGLPDVKVPDLNPPATGWYVEQVMSYPDFITPIMDGPAGAGHEIYFEPYEMPPLPDCKELGVEDCQWQARMLDSPSGQMIEVELRASNGKVVGRTELLRVQTAEFEELQALQRIGYNEGWIARIEVLNVLRGNGFGRTMWRAGDTILRITSGGGALRIFSDRAGWGSAIMKYVPADLIVIRQPPLWAYIIE